MANYALRLFEGAAQPKIDDLDTKRERLLQWAALALTDSAGQTAVRGWSSFTLPQRIDHANLVPLTQADVSVWHRYKVILRICAGVMVSR